MTIVISKMTTGEILYWGPFANGDEATQWADHNLKGFEWHWNNITLINQPEIEEE